jgi:hypothetical protein
VTVKPASWLLIPGALFVLLLLPLREGFTDDGFIHIQYAANIIARGEYSFNAGEVSYGTTSPLWVLILSALGKVFGGGENLIVVSRILSWLSGAGAVFIMFWFGRSLGLRVSTAWLCSLTLAAHVWHLRWTALSMETSSTVLAVAAVGLASVESDRSARRAGLLGCLMAFASLLRPEAYLLPVVYAGSVVAFRWKRGVSRALPALVVYAALVLPWLLFARLHLGQFLPNTAAAKSGGATLNPVLLFERVRPLAEIMGPDALLLAALAFAVVVLPRTRVFGDPYRFLLLWVIALPTAYVVLGMQVLSRYMLLVVPFSIVLGFLALEDLADRFGAPLRRAVVVVPALAGVVLNVALYLGVVVGPSRAFSHDLTHRLKDFARQIKDQSDENAVVAAADIGYLAFYSQRRVLDLGGLVDRSTRRLRSEHPYDEIIEQGLYLDLAAYPRVDFFIDRDRVANRFQGATRHGYRFETVRVERVANLGIRNPGPFYYTLYRLERDG